MKKKFEQGQKVVAISKTAPGWSREMTCNNKDFFEKNGYLFYNGLDEKDAHMLSHRSEPNCGDFFADEDVFLYNEDTSRFVEREEVMLYRLPIKEELEKHNLTGCSLSEFTSKNIGEKGTVGWVDRNNILVRFGKTTAYCPPQVLVRLNEKETINNSQEKQETMKKEPIVFKVGQRVKIVKQVTDGWGSDMKDRLGTTGEISKVDEDDPEHTYRVDFDDSDYYWYHVDELELANGDVECYSVKRSDLIGLHKYVCQDWRKRIEDFMKEQYPLSDDYSVPVSIVNEGLTSANSSQIALIKKIFNIKELSFEERVNLLINRKGMSHKVWDGVEIIIDKETETITVPLPIANMRWTVAAFNWCLEFCANDDDNDYDNGYYGHVNHLNCTNRKLLINVRTYNLPTE